MCNRPHVRNHARMTSQQCKWLTVRTSTALSVQHLTNHPRAGPLGASPWPPARNRAAPRSATPSHRRGQYSVKVLSAYGSALACAWRCSVVPGARGASCAVHGCGRLRSASRCRVVVPLGPSLHRCRCLCPAVSPPADATCEGTTAGASSVAYHSGHTQCCRYHGGGGTIHICRRWISLHYTP